MTTVMFSFLWSIRNRINRNSTGSHFLVVQVCRVVEFMDLLRQYRFGTWEWDIDKCEL